MPVPTPLASGGGLGRTGERRRFRADPAPCSRRGPLGAPHARLREGVVMTREISSPRGAAGAGERGASAVEYALILAGAASPSSAASWCSASGVKAAYRRQRSGRRDRRHRRRGRRSGDYSTARRRARPTSEPTPTPTSAPTPTPTPTPPQSATPTPTPTTTDRSHPDARTTPTPTRAQGRHRPWTRATDAKPVDIGVAERSRAASPRPSILSGPATAVPRRGRPAGLRRLDSTVDAGTLVTVSWSYSKGGKLYTGTATFWIT